MNKNVELLNYILQNAEMGVTTLSELNSLLTEASIRKVIEFQLLEYKNIVDQAKRKLGKLEQEIPGSAMAKFSANMMINLKTLMDKSNPHIAEMIMKGALMGIIQITRELKEYVDCDDDVKNIGYKLLWVLQKDMDELKHYIY